MTRVDFYLDAESRLAVAARIAQKSLGARMRLAIWAPNNEMAGQIDRMLWTFSPNAFVAHAMADSPLAAESPIVILQEISGRATFDFPNLINLSNEMPSDIQSFNRIIEIVTQENDDKSLARERFKGYRNMGCEMQTHRLGQSE